MSNDFAQLGINPFESNVINVPSDVSFSVRGFNDKPLEALVRRFDELTDGQPPRPSPQMPRPKPQLVLSPDAGYGKSHLLGRLFEKLGEQATRIYLRPFQAPERAWQSILSTTLQTLESPIYEARQSRCQLDAFALGILAHLSRDYLASERITNESLKSALDALCERPLDVVSSAPPDHVLVSWSKSTFVDWFRSILDDRAAMAKLRQLLKKRQMDFHGREAAWLKVLAACAFAEERSLEERDAALKWLRGDPLEDEEVGLLKLSAADNDVHNDASAQEINDLCYRRLQGLCALAAYFRPFVFCFDQTEYYGGDKTRVDAFGTCIEALYADVPNQLTIVTVNDTDWNARILPNLALAFQARFASPLELKGINLEQAKELISQRMKDCQLDEVAIAKFFGGSWLDDAFSGGLLGVRKLLATAAKHWRQLADEPERPKLSLPDLFARQVNEIRSKAELHQYNQDCLMWFAQDLAKGHDNVIVEAAANRYFSTGWRWPDRAIVFAFEAGDNSARWKAMANEATSLAERAGKLFSAIVFRTPDLAKIPKPSWKAIAPLIEDAKAKGLRIVELNLDDVCALHAARELYSNALQGNVDYAAHEVMGWLKTRFAGWFEKYSRPVAQNPEPVPPTPLPNGTAASLSEAEIEILTCTVRQLRFADVKEVMRKLGSVSLDAVLRAVEQHPNLKAHVFPQTIYLQWRHNG